MVTGFERCIGDGVVVGETEEVVVVPDTPLPDEQGKAGGVATEAKITPSAPPSGTVTVAVHCIGTLMSFGPEPSGWRVMPG